MSVWGDNPRERSKAEDRGRGAGRRSIRCSFGANLFLASRLSCAPSEDGTSDREEVREREWGVGRGDRQWPPSVDPAYLPRIRYCFAALQPPVGVNRAQRRKESGPPWCLAPQARTGRHTGGGRMGMAGGEIDSERNDTNKPGMFANILPSLRNRANGLVFKSEAFNR